MFTIILALYFLLKWGNKSLFLAPKTGLPGFFCSRIPNFQQLDAKIKCEIPNFLWFLLAIRNKLSISVNLLYP